MHIAEKHVRLPATRLDSLLKSDAFRSAAHPIFDSSHVDAALNMRAVFPQSEEEPVFVNALLYSTVHLINRGSLTMESLSLKATTLKLLREKLASPPYTLSPSSIGAVMILKATAYKVADIDCHDAHTKGLTKALQVSTKSKSGPELTPAAKQAIFWLDLGAAVLIDSKRQMSHLNLAQKLDWQREKYIELADVLPIGFLRHQNALPAGLLECIADTVELQECLRLEAIARSPRHTKHNQLDPMQASIESRLFSEAKACRQYGVVAEAVMLGVFMCCYCSYMETWNDSLIPCKLAEKLLDLLEPSILSDVLWLQHMDILLWLLFVSLSVAELDKGHTQGLRSRQSRLVGSLISDQKVLGGVGNLKLALKSALRDFIYKDGWLSQRCNIKEWFKLEFSINVCDD